MTAGPAVQGEEVQGEEVYHDFDQNTETLRQLISIKMEISILPLISCHLISF